MENAFCIWLIVLTSDALEFIHSASQLLPLHPTCLPIPSICRLLYSVVTAVHRGWVSHSFPRPVIAGKGRTLSFSQQGNHGSSHAWRYKSWRLERSALNNYPSNTTFYTTSRVLVSPHFICCSWLFNSTQYPTCYCICSRDFAVAPSLPSAISFWLYSCIFVFFSLLTGNLIEKPWAKYRLWLNSVDQQIY